VWYEAVPEILPLIKLPKVSGSLVYTTLMACVASDSASRFCSSQM
jgi:hypothetical protein